MFCSVDAVILSSSCLVIFVCDMVLAGEEVWRKERERGGLGGGKAEEE